MYLIGFYHRKGTSRKTGNEYDFFQCFFTSPLPVADSNCEGDEALTVNLSPELFYRVDVANHLGDSCSVSYDRFGRASEIRFGK